MAYRRLIASAPFSDLDLVTFFRPCHASYRWFALIPQVSSHQQTKVILIHTNFNLYRTIQSINFQQQQHRIIHNSYVNSIKMFLHKIFTWLEKLHRTRKHSRTTSGRCLINFPTPTNNEFYYEKFASEKRNFSYSWALPVLGKSFLRAKAARTFS